MVFIYRFDNYHMDDDCCGLGAIVPLFIHALVAQHSKNIYLGCRTDSDCKDGDFCSGEGKCEVPSGKVLLESFSIKTESCTGCSERTEGVKLTLIGEKRPGFLDGVPCSSSDSVPLNHEGEEDFQSGSVSFFKGRSENEKTMMGSCFRVRYVLPLPNTTTTQP